MENYIKMIDDMLTKKDNRSESEKVEILLKKIEELQDFSIRNLIGDVNMSFSDMDGHFGVSISTDKDIFKWKIVITNIKNELVGEYILDARASDTRIYPVGSED